MSKPARVAAHTTLEVSPKAACNLTACGMHLWRRASFGQPATCSHGRPDATANEFSALLHAGAASVANALMPAAIINAAAIESIDLARVPRARSANREVCKYLNSQHGANTSPVPSARFRLAGAVFRDFAPPPLVIKGKKMMMAPPLKPYSIKPYTYL